MEVSIKLGVDVGFVILVVSVVACKIQFADESYCVVSRGGDGVASDVRIGSHPLHASGEIGVRFSGGRVSCVGAEFPCGESGKSITMNEELNTR